MGILPFRGKFRFVTDFTTFFNSKKTKKRAKKKKKKKPKANQFFCHFSLPPL